MTAADVALTCILGLFVIIASLAEGGKGDEH